MLLVRSISMFSNAFKATTTTPYWNILYDIANYNNLVFYHSATGLYPKLWLTTQMASSTRTSATIAKTGPWAV